MGMTRESVTEMSLDGGCARRIMRLMSSWARRSLIAISGKSAGGQVGRMAGAIRDVLDDCMASFGALWINTRLSNGGSVRLLFDLDYSTEHILRDDHDNTELNHPLR